MTSTPAFIPSSPMQLLPIQQHIDSVIAKLMSSLPDPDTLTASQGRGIIARYSAVLEGNFIYWMTATLLSVKAEESRAIVIDNLMEEVRDCHPGMLRRFALAANASPSDADSMAVYEPLTGVRLFLGRLGAVQNLLTMGFFEGFIQRFMAYLADLARRQGSTEMEYTDIHGICDITHTKELFRALTAEMALNPPQPGTDLFEGVELLRSLMHTLIHFKSVPLPIAGSATN